MRSVRSAEGTVEGGFWDRSLPYPGVPEFADAFEAKYKRPASPDAAHGWMAVKIWEQAIAQAGTLDQQKLNEVLHTASSKLSAASTNSTPPGKTRRRSSF